MYTLTVERSDGERLTLTQYRSAYQVTYAGFGPVAADVTTAARGMSNGDKVASTRRGKRNAVLTVYVNGNVEQNRIHLYSYFTPGHEVKLYYANGSRDVYTQGVVESFEDDQFSAPYRVQISIICPEPFWSGTKEIVKEVSGVVSMFSFPFSIAEEGVEFSSLTGHDYAKIENEGDEPTGFVIRAYARENVVEPMIYNAITSEAFRLTGTLEKNHTLTVNTSDGNKRLTITAPGGIVTNALYRKKQGSSWLKLAPGDNYIAYSAAEGKENLIVTIRYNNLYVGV